MNPVSSGNRKLPHISSRRQRFRNGAVEVPVFLTLEDIRYYRSRGFDLDFESEVVTGHIDFLQIRNGHLHILDYKPDARKETHARATVAKTVALVG